jgi:nucleotidyltransferase substrate binding protein (TIGR01987 family)
MSNELKLSLEKLNKAVKKLDEGVKMSKDQLDRDGVIQRFEFTFELSWKTLRLFLIDQGIITKSPKDALKEAFKYGLIKDENIYLDMLEDRNQTSHIYNEEISKGIYSRIKKYYSPVMLKLVKEIKKEANK